MELLVGDTQGIEDSVFCPICVLPSTHIMTAVAQGNKQDEVMVRRDHNFSSGNLRISLTFGGTQLSWLPYAVN